MARPLGGGGEVRGQGSSRAAAGDVRGGGGGRRYLAMRPLKRKFPQEEAIYSSGNYAALALTQALVSLCGTEG